MDDIDNIDYLTLYNSKLYKDEEKYKKRKEYFLIVKKMLEYAISFYIKC